MGLSSLVAGQIAGISVKLGSLAVDISIHQISSVYDAATGTKSKVDSTTISKGVVIDSAITTPSSSASRTPNLKLGLEQAHEVSVIIFQESGASIPTLSGSDEISFNGVRYKIRELKPTYAGNLIVMYVIGLGR